MDSNERARRAATARKTGKTTTSTSSSSTTSTTTKAIDLPKVGDSTFDKNEVMTNIADAINFDASSRTVDISLPNLPNLTVDGIANSVKLPTIKDIDDIRNPGFSEDEKCDERTFKRAILDYQDAIRYQELIVWSNNYRGSEYKAIASAAKAYTQGLLAKSEIEKTYQQFLELSKQQQVTIQKGIEYIGQSHHSATVQAGLPYILADSESSLEKQRIKAKKNYEEAKQSNIEFDDWLASLKGKNNSNN
jgi:hypothetical protein